MSNDLVTLRMGQSSKSVYVDGNSSLCHLKRLTLAYHLVFRGQKVEPKVRRLYNMKTVLVPKVSRCESASPLNAILFIFLCHFIS